MKTRTMSLLRKRSAKAAVFVIFCLLTGVVPAENWKSAAPIPQGAEEVYGIAGGGKLYVFGGLGLEWKAIGMVMEYDPRAIDGPASVICPINSTTWRWRKQGDAFTCSEASPCPRKASRRGSRAIKRGSMIRR